MKKAKVIIKELDYKDDGLNYITKDKGDPGLCFTMAIGYAVQVAKQSGLTLTKVKELVTDIYKETEDVD